MSRPVLNHFNVHIFRATTDDPASPWRMHLKGDGITRPHERCQRDYSSAGDAVTSARHAINEIIKLSLTPNS